MDIETTEAIDRLSDRIDALEVSLRGEITGVRDELRSEIIGVRDELRGEFREGLAENRRHTEALFESLRDDIRIIAEGLATLATKADRQSR